MSDTSQESQETAFVHIKTNSDQNSLDAWGELSSTSTEKEIEIIAKDLIQSLKKVPSKIDEQTINSIADAVNEQFPFVNHGSGISTIPRQLDYYKKNRENPEILKFGLDCKLPTVVTGFILKSLADTLNLNFKIQFRLKPRTEHPYLYIEGDVTDATSYLVDYINEVQDPDKFGIIFASSRERYKWEQNNSRSKKIVRTLNQISKINLERNYTNEIPLNADGLRQLDQLFIDS